MCERMVIVRSQISDLVRCYFAAIYRHMAKTNAGLTHSTFTPSLCPGNGSPSGSEMVTQPEHDCLDCKWPLIVILEVEWLGPENDKSLARTHHDAIDHLQVHLIKVCRDEVNLHAMYVQESGILGLPLPPMCLHA